MKIASVSRKYGVLVVGAGPAGLMAAITLAHYGINVVLVDKRHGLSGLSRSLVISTRGMELMRRFGLENAVRVGAADVRIRAWMTPTLAAGQGKELPLGYPSDPEAELASPTRPAWAPQDHLERILVKHLCTLPTVSVRFGCEVLEVTQDGSCVRAAVANASTAGAEYMCASYLVAADGAHSAVREECGICMIGPGHLADYDRAEFTAPLWPLVGERRYGLYMVTRPEAAGVLAPSGPADCWGMSRETPVGTQSFLDLGEEALRKLIQRAVGSEAIQPRIDRVSTFTIAAQLADRYREGRCFLVGDAAHRMTPRGGTGMNTALQDGFDLAWKLAWVLQGWAGPGLLATYEEERRPVAAHNVERSGQPGGAQSDTEEALAWDLGGRLPHYWTETGRGRVSTIDLFGDGFTVLAAPADHRWCAVADQLPKAAPVDVHVLDPHTAGALGISQMGALLIRTDGREVCRWENFATAGEELTGSRP